MIDVVFESGEKGRQHAFFVAARKPVDAAPEEGGIRRVAADHGCGAPRERRGKTLALGDENDRNMESGVVDLVE